MYDQNFYGGGVVDEEGGAVKDACSGVVWGEGSLKTLCKNI